MPPIQLPAEETKQMHCARCHRSDTYSGDWYADLCPTCADDTDGEWICSRCGHHASFEAMGGMGNDNPVCCGRPCNQAIDEETMKELKVAVPTYVRNLEERKADTGELADFGGKKVSGTFLGHRRP